MAKAKPRFGELWKARVGSWSAAPAVVRVTDRTTRPGEIGVVVVTPNRFSAAGEPFGLPRKQFMSLAKAKPKAKKKVAKPKAKPKAKKKVAKPKAKPKAKKKVAKPKAKKKVAKPKAKKKVAKKKAKKKVAMWVRLANDKAPWAPAALAGLKLNELQALARAMKIPGGKGRNLLTERLVGAHDLRQGLTRYSLPSELASSLGRSELLAYARVARSGGGSKAQIAIGLLVWRDESFASSKAATAEKPKRVRPVSVAVQTVPGAASEAMVEDLRAMGIPITRGRTQAEMEALHREFPDFVQGTPVAPPEPTGPEPGARYEVNSGGVVWIGEVHSAKEGRVYLRALRGDQPSGEPYPVSEDQLVRRLNANQPGGCWARV